MRYCGAACGQFRFLLRPQGTDRALPGEGPVTGAADNTIPSISPMCAQARRRFYTSDPHGCAQQSLQHVLVPGWQAAGQRAGACARRPARRTRIWPGPGCHRPRWRAPDARRTPCRTGGPRPQAPACRHAHRDPAGGASPIRSSCPGSVAVGAGPPPAPPRPRAGAGGAGPHRRPSSAADHRPATADAGALAPRRRPFSRRRGTQSCGLALRRSCLGLVAGAAAPPLTASGPARPPRNLARARPDPRSSRPTFPRLPGCRPWQDVPAGPPGPRCSLAPWMARAAS